MVRRGFDLSGDINAQADPLFQLVFSLGDLVIFGAQVPHSSRNPKLIAECANP
jgi:hypothetical protein